MITLLPRPCATAIAWATRGKAGAIDIELTN
jgi:hypothetical protein